MGYPTKVATCCYCASRMALRMDKGRHQLSCASCGAPLRDLKMMPRGAKKKQAVSHQPSVRRFSEAPKPVKKQKYVKSKKRSSWFRDLAEEAFEFVEDIFD
jgi:hypothetical protein